MAARPSSVSSSPAGMSALVPQGKHAGKPNLPLSRPCIIIGAASKSHFQLVSPTISKVHAALVQTDIGVYIRDLASRTHVLINGKRMSEALLMDGDYIAIGAFTFLFRSRTGKSLPSAKTPPHASVAVDGEPIPIPIEGRSILIGRRPGCDINLVESSVSNCHALIFEQNGARWIRDLHSRTDTFVNDKPIHQQQLELDDDIRIGETQMRYVATAVDEAHIDELEDLVGTAKLSSDDSVHRQLEPDVPEAIPVEEELVDIEPPRRVMPVAATVKEPEVAAEPEPSEPDEYELAPSAAPLPKFTKLPPPVGLPIPLQAQEPEVDLAEHVSSEAELDGGSLEPLPEELETVSADATAEEIPLALPVENEPAETTHLAGTVEGPIPIEPDLAVVESATASDTVAFDASDVAAQEAPATDFTDAYVTPVDEASIAELEIPRTVSHFDDLIADELHPEAASVQNEAPAELDVAAEDTILPTASEPEPAAAPDFQLPPEPVPHPTEAAFDELIADELHDAGASGPVEVPVDELAAHIEPEPAHHETIAASEIPVTAQSDADFDDLIGEELHPEQSADTFEEALEAHPSQHDTGLTGIAPTHPQESPAGPVVEEASLLPGGASPAVEEDIPELESASLPHATDADFDDLIADELQPEARSEATESSVELDEIHVDSSAIGWTSTAESSFADPPAYDSTVTSSTSATLPPVADQVPSAVPAGDAAHSLADHGHDLFADDESHPAPTEPYRDDVASQPAAPIRSDDTGPTATAEDFSIFDEPAPSPAPAPPAPTDAIFESNFPASSEEELIAADNSAHAFDAGEVLDPTDPTPESSTLR